MQVAVILFFQVSSRMALETNCLWTLMETVWISRLLMSNEGGTTASLHIGNGGNSVH